MLFVEADDPIEPDGIAPFQGEVVIQLGRRADIRVVSRMVTVGMPL
jgi:hypothetical protein